MTSEERAQEIMNAGLVPRWVVKSRIQAAIDAAVAEAVEQCAREAEDWLHPEVAKAIRERGKA